MLELGGNGMGFDGCDLGHRGSLKISIKSIT
jgi:hypothetical protein